MSDKKIPFAEDSWLYDRETPADSSDKTAGKEPVEEKKSGIETADPEPEADSGKKADSREISVFLPIGRKPGNPRRIWIIPM